MTTADNKRTRVPGTGTFCMIIHQSNQWKQVSGSSLTTHRTTKRQPRPSMVVLVARTLLRGCTRRCQPRGHRPRPYSTVFVDFQVRSSRLKLYWRARRRGVRPLTQSLSARHYGGRSVSVEVDRLARMAVVFDHEISAVHKHSVSTLSLLTPVLTSG